MPTGSRIFYLLAELSFYQYIPPIPPAGIAGAGFSYGAKNIQGQVPPADELKKKLLLDMGMDKNSDHGLEVVANYYKNKKGANELIDKLKEQYDILKVAEYHKKIMTLPWKRVYC